MNTKLPSNSFTYRMTYIVVGGGCIALFAIALMYWTGINPLRGQVTVNPSPLPALTARDNGLYAAAPWPSPAAPFAPGSSWDRTKDLSFAIINVNART